MEYNWEEIAMSQLRLVQRLTSDYDKMKEDLSHKLEIANNSIKTLLKEQSVLVDRIGQLEYLLKENKTYEAPKEVKVIQEDLFDLDKTTKKKYNVNPNVVKVIKSRRRLNETQAEYAWSQYKLGRKVHDIALELGVNNSVIDYICVPRNGKFKTYRELNRN